MNQHARDLVRNSNPPSSHSSDGYRGVRAFQTPFLAASVCCLVLIAGCDRPAATRPVEAVGRAAQLGVPADTLVKLKQWRTVEDFEQDLAQFETVFWDAADTTSLREQIQQGSLRGKRVLEIGTGTGLLSLCCIRGGAEHVVATDINPSALANADYNAELLGYSDRLELRLVSQDQPTAFAVLQEGERFDLIVSNPPWEDGKPTEFSEYAFYDPGFTLLDSLLSDLHSHLNKGGRLWLAYGCVEAIRTAQRLGEKYSLRVQVLDKRDLDSLENLFLPGIMLEVTPQ